MDVDIPGPTLSVPKLPAPDDTKSKEESRQTWEQEFLTRRMQMENHSLWSTLLYRLSIADSLRDAPSFSFPTNLDFRGRVYPMAPYFSHIGDDVSRGMLSFAKGEKLGEKGLRWLKIHCINLTGTMKRQKMEERLEKADEIIDTILDSADNPLDGRHGWWRQSEDPWQTLACCMEIRNALACPEGPENYVSNLPVHQDGSCNGLQHYAALGRDEAGAKSVNVAAADTPADIYTDVAKRVEEYRANDENEIAKKIGENVISRKVVKQTVMTIVYGVTKTGARLQVRKQLRPLLPSDLLTSASGYVVDTIWKVIDDLFTNASHIQRWMAECTRIATKDCYRTMEWVTPLGLPCVQPYMTQKTIEELSSDDRVLKASLDLPNASKQKNSFAPNFIHSLDSTHMMLTALHCQHAGITFASVHDCFWTHASTVDRMNVICRDQFVNLHKEEILHDLGTFLSKTYVTEDVKKILHQAKIRQFYSKFLREIPPKGTFDLNEVKQSAYFFN